MWWITLNSTPVALMVSHPPVEGILPTNQSFSQEIVSRCILKRLAVFCSSPSPCTRPSNWCDVRLSGMYFSRDFAFFMHNYLLCSRWWAALFDDAVYRSVLHTDSRVCVSRPAGVRGFPPGPPKETLQRKKFFSETDRVVVNSMSSRLKWLFTRSIKTRLKHQENCQVRKTSYTRTHDYHLK